jgi:hypothetical protein
MTRTCSAMARLGAVTMMMMRMTEGSATAGQKHQDQVGGQQQMAAARIRGWGHQGEGCRRSRAADNLRCLQQRMQRLLQHSSNESQRPSCCRSLCQSESRQRRQLGRLLQCIAWGGAES